MQKGIQTRKQKSERDSAVLAPLSLHPSLTLGSQKHMQELDVLLRRLLPQFSNLEPKANTEFKIRTYQMGRGFSSTQVRTFCFVLLKGKRDKAELITYSQEENK